jgi:tetratricopeptide (TPR) repeat protein
LNAYYAALEYAQALGIDGLSYLGNLYMNVATIFTELSDFQTGERYLEQAYQAQSQIGQTLELARTKLNLAELARLQGHFRQALSVLLSLNHVNAADMPIEFIQTQRMLCETYLKLNRHKEARELARSTIDLCRQVTDIKQELSYVLRSSAIASAEMGQFKDAQSALDEAEAILTFAGAQSWVADVWLKRGQIALRQGAASITQLEILPRPPEHENTALVWPDWPLKLRTSSSQEEGCERDWAVLTKRALGANGRDEALECVRVAWAQGADGRWAMQEMPDSGFELKADLVLLAMGFLGPRRAGMVEQSRIGLDPRGNIAANTLDYRTSLPKVFAAGDMRRGQSLVVWAIREGRQCARAVDEFLMGSSKLPR